MTTKPRPKMPWEAGGGYMGPLPAVTGCDCHICRPDPSYDVDDRRAIDTVLRCGWQVFTVSGSGACSCCEHDPAPEQSGSGTPDFAYTVGLGHRYGHPELLIAGLRPELMHSVLNEVARRVMEGRRFEPGDVLEGVLGNAPVVLEQVTEQGLHEAVTWSGWFHRRRPDALMIVWPNTSGVFEWQPGAPEGLSELQPRSWREPFNHTGAAAPVPEWLLPVPAEQPVFTCTHVIDQGEPILWAARQPRADGGEDWNFHCGEAGHATDDIRLAHVSHVVRGAPSVNALAGLALDAEAWRDTVDSPWQSKSIAEGS